MGGRRQGGVITCDRHDGKGGGEGRCKDGIRIRPLVDQPQPSQDELLDRGVEILKALANPTRLKIVQMLLEGQETVTVLVDALGLRQSLVSHELGVMREKGIVRGTRVGYYVRYCLVDPLAIELARCIGAGAQEADPASRIGEAAGPAS